VRPVEVVVAMPLATRARRGGAQALPARMRAPTPPAPAAGPQALTLRARYPLAPGDVLCLRTDSDWDRDIPPSARDAGGSDFTLHLSAPFQYYKIVLRRGGDVHWSLGDNRLLVPQGEPVRETYPYFFAGDGCSVGAPFEVGGRERTHTVRVFLPPGYDENTRARYPVLYMHDAQNLFFPAEAFAGHAWKIDETLRILDAMNLIRTVIVVGIYPRDRMTDYTQPGYEAYGRYVASDLKPWIDARYRTSPNETATMGSSLGGVVSFYLGWQYPHVFGRVACLSTTFGYRDDLWQRVAREPRRALRLYLDSGWPNDNYEVTRSLRSLLVARGARLGDDLLHLAFPRAAHDEQAWAMRAHIPIQHLFGADA
jgi:predicted alpha/beta superfamily hydrolase